MGGVGASHGGTRDSVIGGVAPDPGEENDLTYNVMYEELVSVTTNEIAHQEQRLQHTCPSQREEDHPRVQEETSGRECRGVPATVAMTEVMRMEKQEEDNISVEMRQEFGTEPYLET